MITNRLTPILALGLILVATAAQADPRITPHGHRETGPVRTADWRGPGPDYPAGWHRGPLPPRPVVVVPAHRMRHYRDVVVVRPHGRWYAGYGFYTTDADAYRWLALTAITLGTLDFLSEQQERAHEAAQVRATTAPIGQTIVWSEGGATGSVTVLREGHSTTGQYCREFQQNVTIGGKTEQAYGTACLKPDGAWQVVSAD